MQSVSVAPPHNLLAFLAEYRINEYSDILGLLLTLIGFGLTLWKLSRTRRAAEAARDAANKVALQVTQLNSVVSLQDVLSDLEELKGLLRQEAWGILVAHLPKSRRALIQIRESVPGLSSDAQKSFQGTITTLKAFEDRAHRVLTTGASDADIPKMIGRMIANIDNLNGTLQQLRNAIPRSYDNA